MTDATDTAVQSLADITDPASYPAGGADLPTCSLVMKGGITSGVIYPRAVCQVATTRPRLTDSALAK